MSPITLATLGHAAVRAPDGARFDALTQRPKPLALLCHIAMAGVDGERARSELLAMFWPEADDARGQAALRKTLHTLRDTLGGDVIVGRGRHAVALGRGVTCDALTFVELHAQRRFAEALTHYHGPFMSGFHLAGCKAFEHWMEGQRTRFARMALDAAVTLRDESEQQGAVTAALFWAYRAETLAPQNEEVLRRTLHLMAHAGDRAGAIGKFERFSTTMDLEFGLQTEEETRRLVDGFRAPRSPEGRGPDRAGVGASLAVLSLTLCGAGVRGRAPALPRAVTRAALEAVMGAARRSARDGDSVVRTGSRSCVIIASGATSAIGRNLKGRVLAELARLRGTGGLPEGVTIRFRVGRSESA